MRSTIFLMLAIAVGVAGLAFLGNAPPQADVTESLIAGPWLVERETRGEVQYLTFFDELGPYWTDSRRWAWRFSDYYQAKDAAQKQGGLARRLMP